MATRMVVTDLDGTLLSSARIVSPDNLATLEQLGQQGIVRVIATGRSLYSFQKVIPRHFPIDYLVFSSGAGIFDWTTQELLLSHHLSAPEVRQGICLLVQHELDFMLHHPIPENHHFWYREADTPNPDFLRRYELYKAFASHLDVSNFTEQSACQFLAITRGTASLSKYEALKMQLSPLKVIRTTSPLDNTSFWIEIFPQSVSKALASGWLAQRFQLDPATILAIGNDYNDLDLLQWAGYSFVVSNAPDDLKQAYTPVASNDLNGFSEAVKIWINC
ncbi:MAG: HAD family phosphatase [bacterium]|nr:HAD family phosphatase [bacterium]